MVIPRTIRKGTFLERNSSKNISCLLISTHQRSVLPEFSKLVILNAVVFFQSDINQVRTLFGPRCASYKSILCTDS